MIPAEDFEAWRETDYLLRSPANARRLREAVARDKADSVSVGVSMEVLESLAGTERDP
ncbi:hypothetical protein O7599_13850 [Streptomyces sp. WMMC500]|uniref:type II toxin-antitoxin system Phd/YefM family antitoxin n=1 Tax=Streptomyces sp. WMMC500 TaxID=3015154 RepID=UPI00248C7C32|nr:hypothetical protein [Streptomyces sp. WMMC500]WBB63534.1 hypothetical protein O7599_13850 [Streptomyces sp. WMMC500]